MTNAERYREDIEELNYCFALSDGEVVSCAYISCTECEFEKDNYSQSCTNCKTKWLLSEYEEPKIEPAVYNLKVDDKVEVSDDGVCWVKKHFKCIEGNFVIAWARGQTSFTAYDENDIAEWEYARVPREEISNESMDCNRR